MAGSGRASSLRAEPQPPSRMHVSVRPTSQAGDRLPRLAQVLSGSYRVDGENHGKPLYAKTVSGEPENRMCLYFWDPIDEVLADASVEEGWYFGRQPNSLNAYAWKLESSDLPPNKGWTPNHDRGDELDILVEFDMPAPLKRDARPTPSSAPSLAERHPILSASGSGSVPIGGRRDVAAVPARRNRVNASSAAVPIGGRREAVELSLSPNPMERRRPAARSPSRSPIERRIPAAQSVERRSEATSSGTRDRTERARPSAPPMSPEPRDALVIRSRSPRRSPKRKVALAPTSARAGTAFLGKTLCLKGKKLDDSGLKRWLASEGAAFVRDSGCNLDTVDVSSNSLTDDGFNNLVDFLMDNRLVSSRLRFFANRLKETPALGSLIEDRHIGAGVRNGLRELHLSDNQLSVSALERILDCLRHCALEPGTNFKPPFWLRAEQNEGLAAAALDILELHRKKGLRICLEGGKTNSGCTLKHCKHGADVHLILNKPAQQPLGSSRPGGKATTSPPRRQRSAERRRPSPNAGSGGGSLRLTPLPGPRSRSPAGRHPSRSLVIRSASPRLRSLERCSRPRVEPEALCLRPRDRTRSPSPPQLQPRTRSRSRARSGSPRQKSFEMEYRGAIGRQRKGAVKEVQLSDRKLGDAGVKHWCSANGEGPRVLETNPGPIDRLDLSKNGLTDRGVDHLVSFLRDKRQAVSRLLLYMNKLADLKAVCDLIEDRDLGAGAPRGLAELHLSSNNITLDAFKRLMESFRRRARDCKGFKQPIWLRLERNNNLEEHAQKIAEDYWHDGLKVCFNGGLGEKSGCGLRKCRQNADVHLHLHGANQANNQRKPQAPKQGSW